MSISRAARAALLLLVCGLAAVVAAFGPVSNQGSSAAAAPTSKVAGTIATRLTIDRFRAVGRKVVGLGTVVSTWRSASGHRTVKRKHFRFQIRGGRAMSAQEECQILFLEIGDLDLTLAGLHVTLHAFDPTEPVRLRLSAIRENGVLGRLFCDLAQSGGLLQTHKRAHVAAFRLTKRLRHTTVMRVRATVYVPGNGSVGSSSTGTIAPLQATDECQVLHLILGPLHLDLLGLVVDLNKIDLNITAIPGTLLGDIFCQLAGSPPPPPAPTPARVSR
jgi:hypothetical protein